MAHKVSVVFYRLSENPRRNLYTTAILMDSSELTIAVLGNRRVGENWILCEGKLFWNNFDLNWREDKDAVLIETRAFWREVARRDR